MQPDDHFFKAASVNFTTINDELLFYKGFLKLELFTGHLLIHDPAKGIIIQYGVQENRKSGTGRGVADMGYRVRISTGFSKLMTGLAITWLIFRESF
jgi:hypothetical protein